VRPEAVVEGGDRCGEGPIWEPAGRRLVWNDLSSNLVFEFVPATGRRRVLSRDLRVSGIALRGGGGFVFAGSGGIHVWEEGVPPRTLHTHHGGEALCFNDIRADRRGRVYAGTVYWGAAGMERTGKLFVAEPGGLRVVDEGIELSNGLAFSPDGRTLYFADSAARRIYSYDVRVETGDLTRRRVFVQVPPEEGLPDGLTVDREGFVWCAQWYGAQVVRYDPEGRVERRIPMPVTQVSSVAFGGEGLDDLYVTTAAEPWPSSLAPPGYDPQAPTGGALYRVRAGVQGLPEPPACL
jgi:D-xylonolactonase